MCCSVRYLASENGTPEVAYIELAGCIGSINGGTSLLLHAEAEARNVGARVFILRADPAAVEFWQNLGFANTVYDDDLAALESLSAWRLYSGCPSPAVYGAEHVATTNAH